ncbi:Alpha/Beta hydrolase protein [Roridomyces roridus]|uniref:Alpha/Beta hydrolase protein n=1 Tax=Roridomyces roridus TaxID=1738132 RepID=A0AAD7C7D6_9AGAR|nr:Alpha/Beta hydrolase protein [Roridomyces roridus]
MFPSPTLGQGLTSVLQTFFAPPTPYAAANVSEYNIKPFKVDLGTEFQRLHTLVALAQLPSQDLYPEVGFSKGIELTTLSQLRQEWLTDFNWEAEQAEMNKFAQYTAEIEGLKIHFISEQSADPDAIPLIMLHGWSGSFHEFLPVIPSLTDSSKPVSYHVVVPSLPGHIFSSPPKDKSWTCADTARVFNTLMTEVLGYSTYAVHGTDWGAIIGYSLYANFPATVTATHLVMLPFMPPTPPQRAEENVEIDDDQKVTEGLFFQWATTGNGYFIEQATKPKNLGLALHDSPIGQLAWIGAIWLDMSDPQSGTSPSLLTHNTILTTVSLYYLTGSFYSSIWIYEQNPEPLAMVYSKAKTEAPLFVGQFKYNPFFWPKEYAAKVGNLAGYKVHKRGGHYPGWDNPVGLVEDLREMAAYLKKA